jgi:hypothetical protein
MARRRPWPVPAALVALALVAGCTVRYRPDQATGPPDPAPATTATRAAPAPVAVVRGTTTATRAYVLGLWPSSGIRPGRTDALPVTLRQAPDGRNLGATSVVLVFPLLERPPGCLRRVELWLRLLSFDQPQAGQPPAILAAYPSKLTSLARGRLPDGDPPETLIDNRPRGTGRLAAGGAWMVFEITGLYRTWAAGGPFPSQLRTVEEGTPLVVDVRSEHFGQPAFVARFGPLGRDREAPQLRWTARRHC